MSITEKCLCGYNFNLDWNLDEKIKVVKCPKCNNEMKFQNPNFKEQFFVNKHANVEENNLTNKLYKKNSNDQIWWVNNRDQFGEHVFTFDKKKYYNLFKDYPYNLTPEEQKIFDKENPYWANYFADRK